MAPRLDIEISDWHATQPEETPHTIVIDHYDQPDTTGLGPPMSAHYVFTEKSDDPKTNPTD